MNPNPATRFTYGDVAEGLQIPYQTVKTWRQRGFLDFIRGINELDPGDRTEVSSTDPDGIYAKGRWFRYTKLEFLLIAIFSEFAAIAPPAAAASFMGAARTIVLTGRMRYLALARIGRVYAMNRAKSHAGLLDNWTRSRSGKLDSQGNAKLDWHVDWLTEEGKPAAPPDSPGVPASMYIVDIFAVKQKIDSAVASIEAARAKDRLIP